MASPHAATSQQAQTPLAANAAKHPDIGDARPVRTDVSASAGGDVTHQLRRIDL